MIQLVKYTREGQTKTTQVILKRKKNNLLVSIISPIGIELLTIEYDGNKINPKRMMPGMKSEYFYRVMADMMMIYMNIKDLNRSLGPKLKVKEFKKLRKLVFNKMTLIEINYKGEDLWKSKILYKHFDLNYELAIETLSVKYENLYK